MGTGHWAACLCYGYPDGLGSRSEHPQTTKNKNAWFEILCKVVFSDVSRQEEHSPPPLPSLKTVGREEDKGNLKFKNTIDPLLC